MAPPRSGCAHPFRPALPLVCAMLCTALLITCHVPSCCGAPPAPPPLDGAPLEGFNRERGWAAGQPCLGEFEYCGVSGACAMFERDCSACGPGQYVCPDHKTCAPSAAAYTTCPAIAGTHLDWRLPVDRRLEYLVSITGVDERIAQLTNDAPEIYHAYVPSYNWLNDDEHGVKQPHATSFPNGCSLGASWNKTLLNQVGRAIGVEARGLHNGFVHDANRGHDQNGLGITMYAPNMNLVRDPRWGRAQEVYSEDPYLTSALTVQFVTGAQVRSRDDKLLTVACCKHYAAYDLESIPVLRYNFSAQLDARNLWETYMPGFEACVRYAQGAHVMCSYNAINGVPTCADPQLLNGVLREKWRWAGFVVSDYDAWANIKDTHYYCPNYTCAAAVGINAGMDQEGGGTVAIEHLPDAMAEGLVEERTVTEAFKRLFAVRIALGMLDPPTLSEYNYIGNSSRVVESPAHMELARDAARQGMCLYQNKRQVLPVALKPGLRMVLVGPQMPMRRLLLGNYAVPPDGGIVSIAEGIGAAVGDSGAVVQWVPGCFTIECITQEGFDAAAAAAAEADIVVVSLGLDQNMESEGHDRSSIELPPNQYELVARLREAAGPSTPLVAVLVHGGTIALKSLPDQLDAILDAWYPGMQGGNAVSDVLFGAYSPAGRAGVTFYRSDDDLPPMGNMDLYAYNGTTYRHFSGEVDIPFGFGLSYTEFEYSALQLASSTVGPCDVISLNVTVANTGLVDSDEVVQVYVQQVSSQLPAPNVRLAAFERVHVRAGEKRVVALQVLPSYRCVIVPSPDGSIYDAQHVVEAGQIELSVGGGQPGHYQGALSASVSVTASSPLSECTADHADPALFSAHVF